MKITAAALNRPVAVTVLVVATFAAGLFSLTQLDVNYLPDISYPMVKIHVWWRGATADDIETNIADPLEEVIATVDGLDYIESSSIEGMYTLLANFSYGVNVEVAFQDVVAAMGRVTKKLPRDMDPPVIIKADPSQLPVIEVMLTSDEHDLVWLREWADVWLVDRLTSVPGMVAVLRSELVFVVGGVVLISLLVALTLTPLLTDRFLRGEASGQMSRVARAFDWIIGFVLRGYERLLGGCLRAKWLVVVLAFAAFTLGVWLAIQAGTQFLPKLDDGRVMVKLKMPSGTSVGEVDRILALVENRLQELPEIESLFRLTGGRVFGLYTLEVGNEGNLNIQTKPEYRVHVDRARASAMGISVNQVATTLLGLVPLAMNLGEGGGMRVTMAIAVIGGLLYSLLLTLLFLPAVYGLIRFKP